MRKSPQESRPSGLITLLATGFGSGLLPKMPGTWGSLAALPPAWGLLYWGGPWALGVGVALVFLVGIWVSDAYVAYTGRNDPGEVVIDEFAGQWIALLPAAMEPVSFAIGFALFRVFDVWKPWPVGWADRTLKGGIGIMVDDVIAGFYAAAILAGLGLWVL